MADASVTAAPAMAARRIAPGFLLSALVAVLAVVGAPWVARVVTIPAVVLALLIGIALNRLAARPVFAPGLAFCVKQLLRWAVALLGLRIALGDIAALGLGTGVVVVVAMAATVVSGFLAARLLGLPAPFGALVGVGTAVCGASATLATSAVLPDYRGKDADVVFVVIGVNALATLAMVVYPPLSAALGFDDRTTGVMLGATIHDVAQVVGAGYAVSDAAGNAAVIVKLFRVFLLLPVVLAVGWWFARRSAAASASSVPVPVFAFVFLALCILNSVLPALHAVAPLYARLKGALVEASTDGLLVAIGALGLGTSVGAIGTLGWRHIAAVGATTLVILVVATAGLVLLH
ncbi:MAG TPA: putative sulfate exporter family transporter [Xanthobacteraceae bacterium]|nr:putative sulfate exporter family transporter [Xanthobacteraceae bacterium]